MRGHPSWGNREAASILALAALLITSCAMPVTQLDEGLPPGHISGDIPDSYRGLRSPFSPGDLQALEAGRGIYQSYCVGCHGASGRGDGPLTPYLEPAPADFSAPPILAAFSEHEDYLFWWVSEGVTETSMPAYRAQLSETERWQVIGYARSLGEQGAGQPPPRNGYSTSPYRRSPAPSPAAQRSR